MDLLSELFTCNPYLDLSPSTSKIEGWNSTDPIFLDLILETRPTLIVEVGTWLGKSAIHMAGIAKAMGIGTKILCVDTWLGSTEMWLDKNDESRYGQLNLLHGYPAIYDQFINNVVNTGHQDCIVPFPQTSANAARWLGHKGVRPELVYLDASHEFENVALDLKLYWPLVKPGGILFGDDIESCWPGVDRALAEFCIRERLQFEKRDRVKWLIRKPL